MKITTIGIDSAKNVFQVHGVDAHGKVVLRKKLARSTVPEFFIQLQPCLIGMEACGLCRIERSYQSNRVKCCF